MNSLTNKFNTSEWVAMKISISIIWIYMIFIILTTYDSVPLSTSICKILPCNLITSPFISILVFVISIVILLFYILEVHIKKALLAIFIISVIVFTIEESNGILNRRSMLSFIFFAQLVAYLLYEGKNEVLKNQRILLSIQVVAAAYTLSALSKLEISGFQWFLDGKNIVLQILKSNYYDYIGNGDIINVLNGWKNVELIQKHTYLLYLLLASSLILELFSFISILGKRQAFVYGALLSGMHIGIYLLMNIRIEAIILPMVIFMVNPLYLFYYLILSPLVEKIKNLNYK